MFEKIQAAKAFWQTKSLQKKLTSRREITLWQEKKISFWLQNFVSKTPFYNQKPHRTLDELPIINKKTMMDAFVDFNRVNITLENVKRCLEGKETLPHIHCGMSTGTSGNRTYYIISDAERYLWLGTILGKLLPSYPFNSARIAVALPMATPLYQSANHLWRLQLSFFNLNDGLEQVTKGIDRYQPDTLIAPPHLLRYLAEANIKCSLKRLYSAGEVLDPFDQDMISKHFNMPVYQIYMASEGLLATPCRYGKLHLCEDVMHFSYEKTDTPGLVNPIITDFIRNTQIMARYRMNDLLRLDSTPCSCGSPFQSISEVIGRKDDCFHFVRQDGRKVVLTPDILRNTILDASPQINDFRLIRSSNGDVVLQLPLYHDENVAKHVIQKLQVLFSRFNIECTLLWSIQEIESRKGVKIRRVENRYKGKL